MVKPKVSTGYLTPQGKKTKPGTIKNPKPTSQDAEMNHGFNEELFEALMKDPEKKKVILQLLKENKKVINDYRKKEELAKVASPTHKVKNKEKHMESPTALLRRRAMEKMHGSPCSCPGSNTTSSSHSRCSSPNCSTPVPLEKVLDGVVAFLEIKNRQGEDKSAGAKSVLSSMGAKIRDTFTSDVTHVIYKDGSHSTYQRAKSMNIHLVSILWVEFCRKSLQKQNERLYPALRSAFDDESIICSQMEKDYEEIIRDEYKKSLTQGTPLPSTRAIIDRRRTLMTPALSALNCSNQISENSEDDEVARINGFNITKNLIETESLVMNDPENFSQPAVKNSQVLASVENIDMELTTIPETQSIIGTGIFRESADMELGDSHDKTRKSQLYNRRRTICGSFMSSDDSTLSNLEKSKDESFAVPKGTATRKSKRISVNMSINEEESFVIGRNSVRTQKRLSGEVEKTTSAISVLKISSDDQFSLRLTEDSDKQKSKSVSVQLFSDKTDSKEGFALQLSSEKVCSMSALQLSPDKSATNKRTSNTSFSSTKSFLNAEYVSSLVTPDKISGRNSTSSNDSEVMISFRNDKKCFGDLSLKKRSEPDDEGAKDKGRRKPRRKTLGPAEVRCLVDPPESRRKEGEVTVGARTRRKTLGPQKIKNDLTETKKAAVRTRRKTLGPEQITVRSKPQTDKNSTDSSDSSSDGSIRPTSGKANIFLADSPESPRKEPEASVGVRTRRKTLGPQKIKNDLTETKKTAVRPRRKTMGPQQVGAKLQNDKNFTDSSDSSGGASTQSKSGKRKLYRPGVDELLLMEVDDDKERQQRREELQSRKRKSNENIVLPLGPIMNNLPLESTSSESEAAAVTPPKRDKKSQKKRLEKNESFDSSLDEQKELLEEVLRRKNDAESAEKPSLSSTKTKPNELEPRTPSTKKPTRVTKPAVMTRSPGKKETPRNRRSTLDYMSKSQIASHIKKNSRKGEKVGVTSIVCTKCHRPDVQLFTQIVKKLGKFIIEDEVTDRTTHLIAGEAKRTVNMLRGLARGCWILKYDWLIRSLEECRWLPEEDFEVTDFSPAVQRCRLERQAFGSKYTMDVFESCPPIYVALSSTPRCSDLRELIHCCKGKIVRLTKLAQIVVGQYCEGAVCVNESWVLDSITFYRKMPFKNKYLIRGNSR